MRRLALVFLMIVLPASVLASGHGKEHGGKAVTEEECGHRKGSMAVTCEPVTTEAKEHGGKPAATTEAKEQGGKAATEAKEHGGKAATEAKEHGGKAATEAKEHGGKAAKEHGGKAAASKDH